MMPLNTVQYLHRKKPDKQHWLKGNQAESDLQDISK